jgi:hypothetical protein
LHVLVHVVLGSDSRGLLDPEQEKKLRRWVSTRQTMRTTKVSMVQWTVVNALNSSPGAYL